MIVSLDNTNSVVHTEYGANNLHLSLEVPSCMHSDTGTQTTDVGSKFLRLMNPKLWNPCRELRGQQVASRGRGLYGGDRISTGFRMIENGS